MGTCYKATRNQKELATQSTNIQTDFNISTFDENVIEKMNVSWHLDHNTNSY